MALCPQARVCRAWECRLDLQDLPIQIQGVSADFALHLAFGLPGPGVTAKTTPSHVTSGKNKERKKKTQTFPMLLWPLTKAFHMEAF